MVVKWLYQEMVNFHSMFQNLHSFELMLGSSCSKVICRKVALKNCTKFTGKYLYRNLFSKKVMKFSGAILLQDICKWPPLSVLYSMIFQKRKHCFKSINSYKSKGNVYALKLKFYLKNYSIAYFFKTILKKASLIFAFTVFLADSLHSSKIDFIMFNVSHKSLQNIQRINCR